MDREETITKPEEEQISATEINLQKWIYNRVNTFIEGRVLEIADGAGIIAQACVQIGTQVEVMSMDLADEDFEDKYAEMSGIYDTLIVLNASEQFKNNRNIAYNSTLLLKPGGYLITRLPARTALFNGLDQGFRHWKRYNLEHINKVLRKDYSIIKTRYFIVASGLQPQAWINKYNERVTLFNTTDSTGFNGTGLSIIVVGKKR